jgi:AraC-like DNA-binding protein
MPSIIVPECFYKNKPFNLLDVDDVTCVEYKHYQTQMRNAVCLTCFTFVVVLSGRKVIHIGDKERYVEKGSAFFANKGAYIFSEIVSEPGSYESIIFCIGDKFMTRLFKSLSCVSGKNGNRSNETSDIFPIQITALLQNSIESIMPLFIHKSNHTRVLLELKLEEILLHLAESDQKDAFLRYLNHLKNSNSMSLSQFMEKNYIQPLTVEAFAQMSGRSLTAFKNEFRQRFNQPPKKWINKKRLEHARVLISTTGMSITDICFESGFESPSYFSYLFKKEFGCSPTSLKNGM